MSKYLICGEAPGSTDADLVLSARSAEQAVMLRRIFADAHRGKGCLLGPVMLSPDIAVEPATHEWVTRDIDDYTVRSGSPALHRGSTPMSIELTVWRGVAIRALSFLPLR